MIECNLDHLKKDYEILRKKYNLPDFYEMNRDFEIEKLQEKDTDFLLREIRRTLIDKNLAYLRFAEMFQNPNQAPMFFLVLAKNLDPADKKLLDEIYLELGKFEIKSIRLDNDYDEKKDAEFIRGFFREWQKIKSKFGKIMKALEDSWDKKSEKKDKNYLG